MNTRNKMMAEIQELKTLLGVKQELVINNNKIDLLVAKIEEKDKKINELENKVNKLGEKVCFHKKFYKILERKLDDIEQYNIEQYTRRLSLRINGIPCDGSAEDCLKNVKEEVNKLGVTIADCEFDRTHRVGHATDDQCIRVQTR